MFARHQSLHDLFLLEINKQVGKGPRLTLMQLTIRLSNTVFGWNKTFALVNGSDFARDSDWGLSVKNKLKPLTSSLRAQAPSETSKLEKDCNFIEKNAVKTSKVLENS